MAAELGDYITLNGTTLLVRGIQAGKPVSEFTSGLRIGRANYDDRQNAFFTVLDDFSGGFGHRILDIRESLGTHWDNEGVDLRHSRQMMLPPYKFLLNTDGNDPTSMILSTEILDGAAIGVASNDLAVGPNYFYYGAGDSLYRVGNKRDTLERVKDLSGESPAPEKITRAFVFRGKVSNTQRLYFVTTNSTVNSLFYYSSDPVATSPTFTAGDRNLWDALPFQDRVIGQDTVFQIIYNVEPTNALDWNIDDANDGEALWHAQSVVRFLGTALHSTVNYAAMYFIDYGDGRLYALAPDIRICTPVGIGDFHYLVNGVVWQGQVVVTNGWNIWLYSPGGGGGSETVRDISLFGRQGVPDAVRDGNYRITGLVDGGRELFAIAERSAIGTQVGKDTTIGFVIFVYNGAGWSTFVPKAEQAIATSNHGANPIAAVIDRYPISVVSAQQQSTEISRALNILCQSHTDTANFVELHSHLLPRIGDVPEPEFDLFMSAAPDGDYIEFETGWFDGGFADIKGALFYAKLDMAKGDATLPVRIRYRLDDDETGAYTTLGTAIAAGTTTMQFDASNKAGVQFRTAQFRVGLKRTTTSTLDGAITNVGLSITVDDGSLFPADGGYILIESEIIRYASRSGNVLTVSHVDFRGEFSSDNVSHLDGVDVMCLSITPVVRALTLVYRKRATLRRTWVAQVDVNKMVEQGIKVDTDGDGTPDTAATSQNVIDYLEDLWNTKTLVQLVVPNQLPSADNVRVEVADYTDNIDDNRLPSTIKGTINVVLIESVAA